jgi:aflatoxin B1 aldehyde reductase
LGISNFLPDDIQKIYDYCSSKGYVLPTVYEGHYNPISRHAETVIFPVLRKLNISYIAYAALSGGFLTKTPEFFTTANDMRWDPNSSLGQLYRKIYVRPKLLEALKTWDEISKESGISKAALSYRWVRFNSALRGDLGDGMIIWSKTPEQLRSSLEALQDGPLDKKVADRIDEVWESVKDEAVLDNYNKDTF